VQSTPIPPGARPHPDLDRFREDSHPDPLGQDVPADVHILGQLAFVGQNETAIHGRADQAARRHAFANPEKTGSRVADFAGLSQGDCLTAVEGADVVNMLRLQLERQKRGIYPLDWGEVDFDALYLRKIEMVKALPEDKRREIEGLLAELKSIRKVLQQGGF